MDFARTSVVITGASRGIGAAAALEFAKSGANVVLLARSGAQITALANEIGEKALAIECDVSDFDQMQDAIDQAVEKFGQVNVLINNAGVIEPISHLLTSDPNAWGQAIDINLKGVYNGVRAVAPGMVEQGGGSILTVSSGAAHGPVEGWSHYCSSKAGAAMLNMCIDKELRESGIRAIGLSPGTVATEMQREIKASGVNPVSKLEWTDHIPPEWPAKALMWMCSDAANPFLGQEISLRNQAILQQVGIGN